MTVFGWADSIRNLKTLLSVLALISTGGGGSTLLGAPSTDASPLVSLPHQAPGATSAAPQVIGLGEEVTGTISPAVFDLSTGTLSPAVDELFFELTAPSDGTLIVHLAWDPGLDLLGLQLEDVAFNYWPPTLGTLQVAAGQTYRLSVWANPWGLSSPVPFVLTTSILPGLVALPRGCETSPPVPDWICIDGG